MNKVSEYFKESYQEVSEKVTWPTWLDLQNNTISILIGAFLVTLIVGIMDFGSNQLIKIVYTLF